MLVLITGGTGFVGAWTAKAVHDRGHEVRFLVRNPDRLASGPAQLGIPTDDFVAGDMTDAAAVRAALTGCDAVVHAAALVATDPKKQQLMADTNMGGALNVLGQAVELGLDPVISVSSIAALFDPSRKTLSPDLEPSGGLDGYGRSKAAVEHYARSLQDNGAPVVIAYPGMVLGPAAGDQMGEAASGIESVLRLRTVPGRHAAWTIIDVRDVADAVAAMLEPGRGPRRYMTGGQRVEAAGVAALIGQAAGRRIVPVPLPDGALIAAGRVADALRPVMPDLIKDVTSAGMTYYARMPGSDDSATLHDFGLAWRSVGDTMQATVDSLRQLGRI